MGTAKKTREINLPGCGPATACVAFVYATMETDDGVWVPTPIPAENDDFPLTVPNSAMIPNRKSVPASGEMDLHGSPCFDGHSPVVISQWWAEEPFDLIASRFEPPLPPTSGGFEKDVFVYEEVLEDGKTFYKCVDKAEDALDDDGHDDDWDDRG